MAVIAGCYLVVGGYTAALIADFIQGCIMIFGVLIMTGKLFANPSIGGLANGFVALVEQASQIPLDLTKSANWISLISLMLLTSLGTWGLPQMVHKFYAIKDEAAIKKGTNVSTGFALLISSAAYLAGALAKLFYSVNPELLPQRTARSCLTASYRIF